MRFFRVLAFFCGKIVKFPEVLPWGWCFEQNIDFEQNNNDMVLNQNKTKHYLCK